MVRLYFFEKKLDISGVFYLIINLDFIRLGVRYLNI